MNKIKLKFKHCYGIKSLEHEFDFSEKRTYSIYAPNGTMKTSFSKAFFDLMKDEKSKDEIFEDHETIREIKKNDGSDLLTGEVFVIESLNNNFRAENESTLLVNKELKIKYDEIHNQLDKSKMELLKSLKEFSGMGIKDIEGEVLKIFGRKDFFELLDEQASNLENADERFINVSYKEIFNDRALAFLNTSTFRIDIQDYIEKFNELLSKSKYLKQGFDHYKVSTIQKTLKENGFFKASHTVNLSDGQTKQEVNSEDDFEKIINEEKQAVLNNKELNRKWEAIDKKLSSHVDLRQFRDYLFSNKEILPEFANVDTFKKKIWTSYFAHFSKEIGTLLSVYKGSKKQIELIIDEAKKEQTDWMNVVEKFNERFFVPFKLKVTNQEDVILKDSAPAVEFVFKEREKVISRDVLLRTLSQGEKRALYILDIMFEIEARLKAKKKTLYIIDDIADSFDYKNKYAIIEYLKDISKSGFFYQIILTHNFDFYRTVLSRFNNYKQCLMIKKTDDGIEFEKARAVLNPFEKLWKGKNMDNPKNLISSISFVRNIIEYTQNNRHPDYVALTSLLHWKKSTSSILVDHFEEIYNKSFGDPITLSGKGKKVLDIIFEEAKKCSSENLSTLLENKIILSIAIRLLAEKFMIEKIDEQEFVDSITTNQTSELYSRYKDKFPHERKTCEILEQVNLMTPENIHLNSFMYEPILDMSDDHLKKLYQKVLVLSEAEVGV